MIQKYSNIRVLEVFFKEPTTIHFIREIGREINLAPTSVKIIVNELLKSGLIKIKKSKPFNGYVANREDELFLFYKRAYNLSTLYELKQLIIESLHPKAIVIFGSYSKGEDIETSDIDLVAISRVSRNIKLDNLEGKLKRKINLMIVENINKFDKPIVKSIYNGIVLYGEI